MSDTSFSDIGKAEAISRLFAGTAYKESDSISFEADAKDRVVTASELMLEGTDFNLVYFPLKHLGYKSVVCSVGRLYAALARPRTLNIVLGISSKLDFPQIQELFNGMASAAREHGIDSISLDLLPSRNGLSISVSATGVLSRLSDTRRPAPKSKDLICVSGALGAAYLGMQLLENESRRFEEGEGEGRDKRLSEYKMLVGAYLKPDLGAHVTEALEKEEIYPSASCFIRHGLADSVKRICRSTGLGAKIYADKIPFEGNTFQLGKELDIDPVSAAMNGGDDCQLLFTIPILQMEKFRKDFQTFDIIGHLAQPEAGAVLVTPDGVELPLRAQGWKEE